MFMLLVDSLNLIVKLIYYHNTTRMKSLARLHVWWPGIEEKIEQFVKTYTSCSQNARDPIKVPLHQWQIPAQPWQRIHVDFTRQFKKKMWLLAVDAFSKWPHYGDNNS